MLDAIRALQYEGTKVEVIQSFKDQGNEQVKLKQWQDAREFYTKAIAVLTDKNADKYDKSEDPFVDAKKEKELEEQCYVNRALCQLSLKNYRATTLDCAAALKINSKNVKAYYRSASALLALNKLHEAEDACRRGLDLDIENVAMQALTSKIYNALAAQKAAADRKSAEQQKKLQERLTLVAALKARDIKIRGTTKPPDLEDAEIHLSPDPLSPKSMIIIPVVFLYPMHAQSDFVKKFAEKDTIGDHLSYLIPMPWDSKGEYELTLLIASWIPFQEA